MTAGLLDGNLESAEVDSRKMTGKDLGVALEDLFAPFDADACVDIVCVAKSSRQAVR